MLQFELLLALVTTTLAIKTPPNEDFYRAAVVEYSPINTADTIVANAKEYASLIQLAGPKADIIVFPEVGLFLYDQYKTYIPVPSPNSRIAPADDENAHPALQIISKEARNQKVYVTINVHEEFTSDNKTYHYNTNVIFNRTGHVIGRYRKFNLFGEPLNITPKPENVYFDSDFGVRFGTFTCFDILFEKPALDLVKEYNVTDILYPTFWYSGLPFFTAVQTQAGWSYALDVNFLASGGNRVLSSNTGSGIYAGRRGPVIYLQAQWDQTTVLVAEVFKKGKSGTSRGYILNQSKKGQLEHLTLWDDPVIPYLKSSLITPQSFNSSLFILENSSIMSQYVVEEKICHEKFCCSFLVNMTVTFKAENQTAINPYQYRLAVFDGITKYNKVDAGAQLCSIISCLTDSIESCGKAIDSKISPLNFETKEYGKIYLYSTVFHNVEVKTETLDKEAFLMPSLFELSTDQEKFGSLMNVNQFTFHHEGTTGNVTFFSDKLITGGLYGRVYSRDGKSSASVTSYFLKTLIFSTVSVLLYTYYHKL